MTPQFVNENYDLLKEAFDTWLLKAKENAQYGSGIFGGGDVRELERICCHLFHSKYALAVSSGTAALHASLISLEVRKNTNVIILGSIWIGLSSLVIACGAKPIFLERNNFSAFLKNYHLNIKRKTVLIYVRSSKDESFFEKVNILCSKNNISIIEDWSALKEVDLKKVSAPLYGAFAVLSFGYDKWIQCGEGGIVLLNQSDLFEKIAYYSQHPISQKAHGILNQNGIIPGLNYRMHPLSATLALAQINKNLRNIHIENNSRKLL